MLCDLGDYDKATSTYARALATSNGAERRSARVPRGRAGRERLVADARRAAHEGCEGREPITPTKSRLFSAPRASRVASRRTTCSRSLERAYAADPSSKQVAALYEGLDGRSGQARPARGRSSRSSSRTRRTRSAARRWRTSSARAGCRVTRTWTRARSSSRSRSSSIPRTKARSTTCATPTVARAATGIACSRSPKKRSRTPARTATRRSSSRRPAPSPGVSSGI